MKEKCVLYDRDCIDCGECEFCDLDPTKLCDNCGKCLELYNADYAAIKIEGIDIQPLSDKKTNQKIQHEYTHCCENHNHNNKA